MSINQSRRGFFRTAGAGAAATAVAVATKDISLISQPEEVVSGAMCKPAEVEFEITGTGMADDPYVFEAVDLNDKRSITVSRSEGIYTYEYSDGEKVEIDHCAVVRSHYEDQRKLKGNTQ